jgi:hypothetical protein
METKENDRHRAGERRLREKGGKPLGPFGSRPEQLLVLAV